MGRILAAIAPALILAGCQAGAEFDQRIVQQQRETCIQSGFIEDSDAFKLCLVLQSTNERIARIERRLDFLDAELSRIPAAGWWRGQP